MATQLQLPDRAPARSDPEDLPGGCPVGLTMAPAHRERHSRWASWEACASYEAAHYPAAAAARARRNAMVVAATFRATVAARTRPAPARKPVPGGTYRLVIV